LSDVVKVWLEVQAAANAAARCKADECPGMGVSGDLGVVDGRWQGGCEVRAWSAQGVGGVSPHVGEGGRRSEVDGDALSVRRY
jgi:hypothetical protein